MANVKAQMRKGKIQMTNDAVRNTNTGTSTKYTDTKHKEERSKATPPFGFSQGHEPAEWQMMP